MFQVGFSERVITPADLTKGVSLAGIRKEGDRKAWRKLDDLFVRVAWFRAQRDFILANGDLLCFPTALCEELKTWVEKRWGIEKPFLLINATHTHSSPHLGNLNDGGTAHPGYREFVIDNLKKGIEEAHQDMRPAGLFFGRVMSGLCVNRRKRVWALSKRGKPLLKRVTVNRPNRGGAVDDELGVLKVIREGGQVAFLISMGCHPNLVNGPVITSDFPGRIRPSLEERLGRPVNFFFLQGFGGNVRPDVLTPKPSFWTNPKGWVVETVEGRSFEKQATEAKIQEVGKHLANRILSIPSDGYKEIKGGIEVSEREIRLPLQSVPPEGDPLLKEHGPVTHEPEEEYRTRGLKQNASVSISIRRIRFGEEVSLIAIPGEVFCEYSLKIKNLFTPEAVLPLGCSDGMVGYLPTRNAFQEGGYEPGRAHRLFGLPAPFTDEIERVILEEISRLKLSSLQ
jgi:hypothetical protein